MATRAELTDSGKERAFNIVWTSTIVELSRDTALPIYLPLTTLCPDLFSIWMCLARDGDGEGEAEGAVRVPTPLSIEQICQVLPENIFLLTNLNSSQLELAWVPCFAVSSSRFHLPSCSCGAITTLFRPMCLPKPISRTQIREALKHHKAHDVGVRRTCNHHQQDRYSKYKSG